MKRQGSDRLLYGRKPVLEVLKHFPHNIEKFVISDGNRHFPPEINSFLEDSRKKDLPVEIVSKVELDQLCSGGAHQGIAIFLKSKKGFSFEQVVNAALLDYKKCRNHSQQASSNKNFPPVRKGNGILVVIDQVSDPQNLGSILRVAEACGVSGIISTIDRTAEITASARKASAGASELIPICRVKNLQRTLELLKEKGFWIVGTSLGENAISLYDVEFSFPVAIVFGSEGKGLRHLTLSLCDKTVTIPLRGKVQSLNVGQAAAVVLFEIERVIRTSSV